jgi:hypothetical protein
VSDNNEAASSTLAKNKKFKENILLCVWLSGKKEQFLIW